MHMVRTLHNTICVSVYAMGIPSHTHTHTCGLVWFTWKHRALRLFRYFNENRKFFQPSSTQLHPKFSDWPSIPIITYTRNTIYFTTIRAENQLKILLQWFQRVFLSLSLVITMEYCGSITTSRSKWIVQQDVQLNGFHKKNRSSCTTKYTLTLKWHASFWSWLIWTWFMTCTQF